MATFRHLFLTYLRRFRVELALWLAVTLGASVLALTDTSPAVLSAVARVEGIAALWVLLRLCLADEAFGTLGGKRTRPIARGTALAARLVLLLAAFLPALLARAFAWSKWASPDASGWLAWWKADAFPLVMQLVLVAALLQGLAGLARGSGSRRLVPALLLGVCGVGLLWLANRWMRENRPDPYDRFRDGQFGGRTEVNAPLFDALPEGAAILGNPVHVSPYNWPDAQPAVEFVRRLPLDERRPERSADGVEWRIRELEPKGEALELELVLRGLPERLESIESVFRRPKLLVRFGNGEFGLATESKGGKAGSPLSLCPLDEVRLKCRFLTPRVRSWNRSSWPELLEGAELWVLRETDELVPSPPAHPVGWSKTRLTRDEAQTQRPAGYGAIVSNDQGIFRVEPVLPREEEAGLAAEVDGVMSMLRGGWAGQREEPAFVAELRAKGRRVLPHLLRWPAWSGSQWQLLVRPMLLGHAAESDLPELVDRLGREPRLVEVFAAKGWGTQALPAVRRRAEAGLALPVAALEWLAADPGRNEVLAELALRLEDGIDRLEPLLRGREDFDWADFARRGWHQRKYGIRRGGDWLYALWAAELGDRSALERLVRGAVLGREWEIEQLRRLIPGARGDLLGFLRENLGRLVFDEHQGSWR